jgi:glycine betaine/proline transport system ATP-binding protein
LAPDPDILIMDEPFSALDPLIRMTLQDELLRLQAELQKTVVFVTHDFDEAARIGSRILLMKDGQVVQVGSPSAIATKPANEYVAAFTARSDPLSFVSMGELLETVPSTEADSSGEAGSHAAVETTTVTEALRSFRQGRGLSVRCESGAVRVVSPENFMRYVGDLYAARGA